MRIEAMRVFIRERILNDPSRHIDADQNLLLTEVLDSLAVIQLVDFLETEYDVTIPPEDVTLDNFATLELIDAYLTTRSP